MKQIGQSFEKREVFDEPGNKSNRVVEEGTEHRKNKAESSVMIHNVTIIM